jgi:hypothetical protein
VNIKNFPNVTFIFPTDGEENIISIHNYQGLSFASHFYWFGRFVSPTWVLTCTAVFEQYVSSFDGSETNYILLTQVARDRTHGVKFDIILRWQSWEPRFKSGFHSFFGGDYICPKADSRMTLEIFK